MTPKPQTLNQRMSAALFSLAEGQVIRPGLRPDMKRSLYARVVLWLIEPALTLKDREAHEAFNKSVAAMQAANIKRMDDGCSSEIADELLRSAGFDPAPSPKKPKNTNRRKQ